MSSPSLAGIAALVIAVPAWAVMDDSFTHVEGWTTDGALLVYKVGDDAGRVTVKAVDVRTGEQKTLGDLDAYGRWRASHPLDPTLAAKRTSALDGAVAHVVGPPGSWSDSTVPGHDALDDPEQSESVTGSRWEGDRGKVSDVTLRCEVRRAGTTTVSLEYRSSKHTYELSLYLVWSPDGRRVAWILSDAQGRSGEESQAVMGEMDVWTDVAVAVGPAKGPRIQLLGKGLPEAVYADVATRLEKGGFAPTLRGPAKSAREKTVVYSAPSAKADAEAIAALLPGGATVEALTWVAPADVVIALGKSAGARRSK